MTIKVILEHNKNYVVRYERLRWNLLSFYKRDISGSSRQLRLRNAWPCSNELMEINVICLVSLIGFRVIKDRTI